MTEQDPTTEFADDSAGRRRSRRLRRASLRPVTFAVLAVLVCGTLLTSVAVRNVMADQEQRLLRDRAGEAAILISSSIGSTGSTLGLVAALAHPSAHGVERFEGAAQLLTGALGDGAAMGAVQVGEDGAHVLVGVGSGPATGDELTGPRGALAARAVDTPGGTVSDVIGEGDRVRLTFALAVGGTPPVVLYQEITLDRTAAVDAGAFDELDGVLYASRRADPAKLVLATVEGTDLSGGPIDRRLVPVGADEWLMVTRPSRSLVGAFAADFRWFVLAGGLLTAALVGALVEVLSRRRTYALQLVEERTAALTASLAEQERLEEGQRRAREAAESANRSKSEFLSRMSHELRTPLNAVLGFAQLLELDDLDEPQKESVDQILRGGRHLLALINEVLDITRIESGRLELSPEPVLAADVVAEVVDLTRPLADRADLRLLTQEVDAAADVHVLADRQRLKQILLNLVANAIKYNRVGGTVAIACEPVGDRLRLKVSDTGPGIAPDDLELVFMPFERLGAERTGVEGTGIGLALSRRLAETMGGTIDVVSAVGAGSTFWVELPLAEGPVERHERLAADGEFAAVAPAVSGQKVLYVEDNISNLRLVERILGDVDGLDLISSMEGGLGLELAREHQPALVLLDLHLPDMRGEEVLRRLTSDPDTASIPVVVISADATSGQVRRLLAGGAAAYLTKPLDVAELLRVLDDLVGSKT